MVPTGLDTLLQLRCSSSRRARMRSSGTSQLISHRVLEGTGLPLAAQVCRLAGIVGIVIFGADQLREQACSSALSNGSGHWTPEPFNANA
jgi:hypothetical protein